jgi:hypothetical protein
MLMMTKDIAEECKTVFKDLNDIIRKYVESGKMKLRDRLKWPFIEKRVTLLRVNLDRLKSTLMLMLEVLKYARSIIKYIPYSLWGCNRINLYLDITKLLLAWIEKSLSDSLPSPYPQTLSSLINCVLTLFSRWPCNKQMSMRYGDTKSFFWLSNMV